MQGGAEPAAADSAAAASDPACDPMQEIIKKAVQSQVAALSEVTPPTLLFAPCMTRDCAGTERTMGCENAALAAASPVA